MEWLSDFAHTLKASFGAGNPTTPFAVLALALLVVFAVKLWRRRYYPSSVPIQLPWAVLAVVFLCWFASIVFYNHTMQTIRASCLAEYGQARTAIDSARVDDERFVIGRHVAVVPCRTFRSER
jgi:hypothetical protein